MIFFIDFYTNITYYEFFHNSGLITRIEQKKLPKIGDMTMDWIQITCLAVRYFNHYTRMFSVLVRGCNWMPFMHGRFCPIHLIHLIGQKSLHFEKKLVVLWWKVWDGQEGNGKCWPPRGQQVWHQRWIWRIHYTQATKHIIFETPGQTSPEVQNRGISGSQKDMCYPKIFFGILFN